jgi:hypothetical protein
MMKRALALRGRFYSPGKALLITLLVAESDAQVAGSLDRLAIHGDAFGFGQRLGQADVHDLRTA